MQHLPKDVNKLKDKDLIEKLFPKEALKKIKDDLQKDKKPKLVKKD